MFFKSYIKPILLCTLIFLFTFSSLCFCDEIDEDNQIDIPIFENEVKNNAQKIIPKIGSQAGIVMDTITGRVLFEKNAYTKRPMASTTKIVTAIVTLERGNLNDTVTVSERAARIGGSVINLRKGEKIKLHDLLYGLMLRSGNDAAIAIAEHIGGSVENFAVMMTQKAKEIGAYDTAFVTPHGLDREGHYTTAYDLALITRYALNNKKFSQIVGTYRTVIQGHGGNNRVLTNTNEMLQGYWGANGVKTGYTGKAGRCLVTSVTRNNWRIISVILGSNSRYQRASDSAKVLDYVFNNYEIKDLNKLIQIRTKISVKKGKASSVVIDKQEDAFFPLRKDEIEQLKLRYDLPMYISAPLEKGSKVGMAVYSIGSAGFKTVDLFAAENIEKKNVFDYTGEICLKWINIMRFQLGGII